MSSEFVRVIVFRNGNLYPWLRSSAAPFGSEYQLLILRMVLYQQCHHCFDVKCANQATVGRIVCFIGYFLLGMRCHMYFFGCINHEIREKNVYPKI